MLKVQIIFIPYNKIMNPSRRQPSYNRLKTYHCERLAQPIKVQLGKKNVNPELTPFHKYPYMHSDIKAYKIDPYNRTFIEKQQYINKTQPTKHQRSMTELSDPSKSQVRISPEKHMRKSFSNLKIRQNFTYIEQIITDLAEKTDLNSTRKYVNRIQGQLAVKCDRIISRMENGYLSSKKQNQKIQASLIKLYSLCHPRGPMPVLSKDTLVKQLQKSITSLVQEKHSSKTQNQKTKEFTQQIKKMNTSLERQSYHMHSYFDEQKAKMKQHYQDIYLKIYEDSQRYKREMELAQKQLRQYDKQQHQFTNKYEGVFQDISVQLVDLKARCQELREENAKQKRKRQELKEIVLVKELKISELQGQLQRTKQELDEANAKLERGTFQNQQNKEKVTQLTKQIQTLKHEIDMQKMVNSLLIQKLEAHNRKNSKDTLLFQLSQKSMTIQEEQIQRDNLKAEIQEDQKQLEYIKKQLDTKLEQINVVNKQLSDISVKRRELEQLQANIEQKRKELDALRSSLVEEEVQLASINQQHQQKQSSLIDLQTKIQNTHNNLQKTTEEITKLQTRKEQTQQQINRLILILVRLQSDQMMSEQNMGKIEWISQWWTWMQQTATFSLQL